MIGFQLLEDIKNAKTREDRDDILAQAIINLERKWVDTTQLATKEELKAEIALLRKDMAESELRTHQYFDAKFESNDAKFESRFKSLDAKFESKFESLDAKFESKFESLDAKFESKFESLDAKFESKFEQLNNKLDSKMESINSRFDTINNRFDTFNDRLRNQTLMILAAMGLFSFLSKWLVNHPG